MKVIDLLNKIANDKNNEKIPKKIVHKDKIYVYSNMYIDLARYRNIEDVESNEKALYRQNLYLDDEVEILEDTTEEIEEIDTTAENTLFTMECFTGIPEKAQDWNFNILKNKVNELARAYNKLNNTTYKAENCMTD